MLEDGVAATPPIARALLRLCGGRRHDVVAVEDSRVSRLVAPLRRGSVCCLRCVAAPMQVARDGSCTRMLRTIVARTRRPYHLSGMAGCTASPTTIPSTYGSPGTGKEGGRGQGGCCAGPGEGNAGCGVFLTRVCSVHVWVRMGRPTLTLPRHGLCLAQLTRPRFLRCSFPVSSMSFPVPSMRALRSPAGPTRRRATHQRGPGSMRTSATGSSIRLGIRPAQGAAEVGCESLSGVGRGSGRGGLCPAVCCMLQTSSGVVGHRWGSTSAFTSVEWQSRALAGRGAGVDGGRACEGPGCERERVPGKEGDTTESGQRQERDTHRREHRQSRWESGPRPRHHESARPASGQSSRSSRSAVPGPSSGDWM